MDPIKIGIGVPSIGRFPPYIAQAAGLFEREHLNVEVVNQKDEEKAVPDIVSGRTPIGTPNAPSLIFSVARRQRHRHRRRASEPSGFLSCRRPTIATVADLKGKRVGINQPRRMAGMMMLALLRKWGLAIETDLKLVDLGINDRSFEALIEKQIDAALLPPEKAFLAETRGISRDRGQPLVRLSLGAAGDDAAFSPRQPRAGHKNLRDLSRKHSALQNPTKRNDR